MSTITEDAVRQEQAEYDGRKAEPPAEPEEEKPDRSSPQLKLPGFDGRTMDAIEVAFSGKVVLDRDDVAHCALIRKLKLGEEFPLSVVGSIRSRAGRTAHDRDGYFKGATLVTSYKVTDVVLPADDDEEES